MGKIKNMLKMVIIFGMLSTCPTKENIFAQINGEDIVIGKSVTFYSNIYKKDIKLSIYMPDYYTKAGDKYPVFYTVQSYFKHAAATIEDLSKGMIPKMIYVHLETYNSGDFLPTRIESRPNSGNADRLITFFKNELIPFIDANYRTQPFRIIESGSWGGIFCLYMLLTQPEVFNGYIVATPWFIYDGENKFMLKNAERFLKNQSFNKNFLFMAIGNDPDSGLHESYDAFTQILEKHSKEELKFHYESWQHEDHWSVVHKAIYDGLKWIFKDWNEVPENILNSGTPAIMEYQRKLTDFYGYDIGIPSTPIWMFCWKLMGQRKFKEAIEMFQFHIQINPDAPYSYTGLGRAYEADGQLELAKEKFKKAYEMAKEKGTSDLSRYLDHIERIQKKLNTKE